MGPLQPVARSLRAATLALWRRPRFAIGATALLTATLFALAVVVALFAAVVLRPLPFADPERLVGVNETVQRETLEQRGFSWPDFVDYRAQVRSARVAAWSNYAATMGGAGAVRVTPTELVDPAYFAVLGVAPATGRGFDPALDAEGTVLISHALWRERFDASPSALGRSISVDGRPYAIVGVMPPGFAGLSGTADLWVRFDAPGLLPASLLANRSNRWHLGVARLAPGATVAALNQELATIGARLQAQYADSNQARSAEAQPLREWLIGDQLEAIRAVTAGVILLLLIALLNLGGLALVRANARTLEHALRRCLGAAPGRLFLDTAAEGAVLGLVAGTLASVLAWLLLPQVARWLPIDLPSFVATGMTPGVALAVIGFGVAGGCAAFALGGLVARRARLVVLRAGARATRAHGTLRRVLVGGEIALGVALLAAALLLARSFAAIAALDPGYRVDSTVVLQFELPEDRYDAGAAYAFGRSLTQLARETAGVADAALASDSPLGNDASATTITSDRLEPAPSRVYRHGVDEAFFDAAGIAFIEGGAFPAATRADGEPLAIVSAELARKLWPGETAVGKRLKRGNALSSDPWAQVVGVVEDTRWRGLPLGPTADSDYFYPLVQAPDTTFALLLRTHDAPAAVAERIVERVRSLDPDVPVYAVQSMAERVRAATQLPRFMASLGLVFAGVALLLSALGVYAIAALDAGQRVRELAIRQAVGADLPALARLFVAEYGRIFAIALVVGVAALVPLASVLRSQLFGVGATDPWSIAGATTAFAVALALGIAAPLRRVLAVQPAELVRSE